MKETWTADLEKYAAQRGLPVDYLRSIVAVETGGNVLGEGDPLGGSKKGAKGLMQLMPATALELLQDNPTLLEEILEIPAVSLNLGSFYLKFRCQPAVQDVGLKDMQVLYGMASAYDGGPGSIKSASFKFSAGDPTKKPSSMNDLDPFLPAESSDYWKKVEKLFPG
jgi:soluble lytic murein transglycosylase-like protein